MIEYLALPYSHKSERVMAERAAISDFIFSELTKEGRIIYAPISSCHHVAVKYGLPRDWMFWADMGRFFVGASMRLLVIPLKGWETSIGLAAEIEIAKENGIEIVFLDLEHYMTKFGQVRRKQRC
jgi:hypothetical protein